MSHGRIMIIPDLHGKVDADGRLVEPDIYAILDAWLCRHPEFRGLERTLRIVRGRMHLQGFPTDLVHVSAESSPMLANYDAAGDADLYEEFLAESESSTPQGPHKIWVDYCDGAEQIEAIYGTKKAMGYLIGKRLLNYLASAETDPEWREEIPQFIAKIKQMFEPRQIAEFFGTTRRLGVLGHTADKTTHKAFRRQLDESDKLREDASNLMLFEWARELLMGEGAD